MHAALAQSPQKGDAGFQHFITRKDNKLYDGDKPFRFAGANMPGIMLSYDFTLYLPERMNLQTALAAASKKRSGYRNNMEPNQ
jgi:hypothetical protein